MWQIGGVTAHRRTQGNLLWEETKRPVPWDVFLLGQLRSNNSAVTSRQSGTSIHLGHVHLGVVFILIKLYMNSKGDQILNQVQKFSHLH